MRRDHELDELFERIYEYNVAGMLSDDRFMRMSRRYEDEQTEIAVSVRGLKAQLEKEMDKSMPTDTFVTIVRKYTRARKLTQRMLTELIDHIEVHHAERIDGKHVQRLIIHYNCIGSIEIPEPLPLPAPDVSVQTRKGVLVHYTGVKAI